MLQILALPIHHGRVGYTCGRSPSSSIDKHIGPLGLRGSRHVLSLRLLEVRASLRLFLRLSRYLPWVGLPEVLRTDHREGDAGPDPPGFAEAAEAAQAASDQVCPWRPGRSGQRGEAWAPGAAFGAAWAARSSASSSAGCGRSWAFRYYYCPCSHCCCHGWHHCSQPVKE